MALYSRAVPVVTLQMTKIYGTSIVARINVSSCCFKCIRGVQERWMGRTYLVYRRERERYGWAELTWCTGEKERDMDGQNFPGVQERKTEICMGRTYLVYRRERERYGWAELTWCTGEKERDMDGQNLPGVQEREKGQNLRGVQRNANRTREIKPSTEFTRKLASLPTNSVTMYAETITGTCGKTSKCATYSVT